MSISTIWQNFCEIVETWNWFSSTFQAQFYVKLNFRFLLKSLIWRILCSNFYGSRVLKKIREIEFSSNNSTNKKDVIWRNFLFFRPLIDSSISICLTLLGCRMNSQKFPQKEKQFAHLIHYKLLRPQTNSQRNGFQIKTEKIMFWRKEIVMKSRNLIMKSWRLSNLRLQSS